MTRLNPQTFQTPLSTFKSFCKGDRVTAQKQQISCCLDSRLYQILSLHHVSVGISTPSTCETECSSAVGYWKTLSADPKTAIKNTE